MDVIGIVKETHALGSVKRKSDGTDLPRRDLSLVDDRQASSIQWQSSDVDAYQDQRIEVSATQSLKS